MLPGRTPVIFFEVPATKRGLPRDRGALRPPGQTARVHGWRGDLGPWTPKLRRPALRPRRRRRRLRHLCRHHRLQALDAQGVPRPRCVGLIETCEESGGFDLPAYLDVLQAPAGRGVPGGLPGLRRRHYDQLWLTTSLRGMVSGVLKVEVLTEGIHSGDASGVVPSSFRILRQVLDRLETARPAACCRGFVPLRDPRRAAGAGPRHGRHPEGRGLESACPGPAAPMAARCR